jgi:hypothetical protein
MQPLAGPFLFADRRISECNQTKRKEPREVCVFNVILELVVISVKDDYANCTTKCANITP